MTADEANHLAEMADPPRLIAEGLPSSAAANPARLHIGAEPKNPIECDRERAGWKPAVVIETDSRT